MANVLIFAAGLAIGIVAGLALALLAAVMIVKRYRRDREEELYQLTQAISAANSRSERRELHVH